MNQQMQGLKENIMRKVKLEKVVLSCSSSGQELEKLRKLLEFLTGKKAQIIKAGPKTRIPDFDVKPGLEIGTKVTLREKEAKEILKRLLGAIDNKLRTNQIHDNAFSFGIKEYIEIPEVEYQREIGIRGLNVTVVFIRAGARVGRRKIKQGKIPKKQHVKQEEIITFMEDNFGTEVR